jgi:hypothetical protein
MKFTVATDTTEFTGQSITQQYENYHIGCTSVEWTKHDFKINRIFWDKMGHEKSLPVRISNLKDMVEVFRQNDLICWLQGRTMEGVFNNRKLPRDHDDDLGVFLKDRQKIEKKVLPALEKQGFVRIRNTDSIDSFFRDGRYIDICYFRDKVDQIGYGAKWFSKRYFDDFDKVDLYGTKYNLPNNSEMLLKEMYPAKTYWRFSMKLPGIVRIKKYCSRVFLKIMLLLPHWLRIIIRFGGSPFGISYKKISVDEFYRLRIEPPDSFNWRWRKRHLDAVTANGRYQTVGEIIDYFGTGENSKIAGLMETVEETNTGKPFDHPHNHNPLFWNSGNNYFIYCIAFDFRSGVVPYSKANEYIRSGRRPLLFTKEYYGSLRRLTDKEITNLLSSQPIEITDGSLTSGKHRVFAMIGRIIKKQDYIPFWAVEIQSKGHK